jgi:hypothetical protein
LRLRDLGYYGSPGARRVVLARRIVAGLLLVGLLIFSSGAAAKEFNPGDLRVCNAKRCVSLKSRPVLNALSAFYYNSAVPPSRVRAPRLGVPFFGLEFSNDYVTGVIAGTQLDRFLSYGVNLDQFRAGVWYRVPTRAVAGLRELTVGLTPLRLTGTAVAGAATFAVHSPSATQPRRAQRPAATSGLPSALGVVSLAALIALASLARLRRRSRAQLPTLRPR